MQPIPQKLHDKPDNFGKPQKLSGFSIGNETLGSGEVLFPEEGRGEDRVAHETQKARRGGDFGPAFPGSEHEPDYQRGERCQVFRWLIERLAVVRLEYRGKQVFTLCTMVPFPPSKVNRAEYPEA